MDKDKAFSEFCYELGACLDFLCEHAISKHTAYTLIVEEFKKRFEERVSFSGALISILDKLCSHDFAKNASYDLIVEEVRKLFTEKGAYE